MRVLVDRELSVYDAGLVGEALDEAGAERRIVRTHLGEPLPRLARRLRCASCCSAARQSALDDADHPYLPDEVALARAFGEAGKPVLGICLGAQLVARAYGAENILGRPLEFGWHEVRPTEAGRADPVLSVVDGGAPLFHWHVDTFTLPPGAVHLAESDMTRDAGVPHRPGGLRHPVPFRGRHGAGRELERAISPMRSPSSCPTGWSGIRPRRRSHGAAADAAGRAIGARLGRPDPL